MAANKDNNIKKAKQLLSVYNLLLNLFWSILSFVPVIVFCYTWMETNLLIVFLAISLLSIFLTNAALDKIQLIGKAVTYNKSGIAIVQQLAQNGALINSLIREKYPAYKAVRYNKKSIQTLRNQTYINEKFHLVGLLFFSLSSMLAFSKSLHVWAIVITLLNLFYNVYPILLQHFIRAKLPLHQRNLAAHKLEGNGRVTNYKLKCFDYKITCLELKEPV